MNNFDTHFDFSANLIPISFPKRVRAKCQPKKNKFEYRIHNDQTMRSLLRTSHLNFDLFKFVSTWNSIVHEVNYNYIGILKENV